MQHAKRPPKPTPHFDTAKAAVRGHPWWSIGTIAALVSILAVFGPWMYGAYTGWVGGFQTVSAAKADREAAIAEAAKIRAEFAAQDTIMRAEFKAQAQRDTIKLAWMSWGQNDLKALVLRNRVNDCMSLKAKKPLSPTESAICSQYDNELATASSRAEKLLDEAQKAAKGAN